MHTILDNAATPVGLPPDDPPRLLVVIDTEEEFDWNAGYRRDSRSVRAMDELWRAEEVFAECGVRPTYVVDHPIATIEESVRVLRELRAAGRCDIGIQLHTWVNPPFEEHLGVRNSFQANLPQGLERAKLATLTRAVEDAFGERPIIHKAGRYGVGRETAIALVELGYKIDLSVAPGYDYSGEGGPDFRYARNDMHTCGPGGQLLSIPTTAGFIGLLHGLGPAVFDAHWQSHPLRALMARGLSFSRVAERVMLSPEGHRLSKLCRLARRVRATGTGVLALSFHSSSLRPGCTPYTRDAQDVAELLSKTREFIRFFKEELGGVASTPLEVHDAVMGGAAPLQRSA